MLGLKLMFGMTIVHAMAGWAVAFQPSQPSNTSIDFDKKIAPLLAARCLECHNSVDNKGDLDLSRARSLQGDKKPLVVPGKLDESLLWKQIDEGVMPPKKLLTPSEKELFKSWIENGAGWGSVDPIDRFAFTTDTRAGTNWWSFQPVVRPEVPNVVSESKDSTSKDSVLKVRNPIDAFVVAKLQARRLAPALQADRRTLIRRVTFDLIGLPPTPDEIRAFESDTSPQAYGLLVDRLLDSKHYGERWARHWLDVARYTESQGFEYDRFRPNAWHYRDYVINALNDDKPYDLFVKEQIAGDAVNFAAVGNPVSGEGIIATSLLVCGPYDQAGNSQANVTQKMITREEELEDLLSVIGQTFLGMTVNCARCHTHKFDPISHEDYYSLKSVFEGVKHGERDVSPPAELAERARQLATLNDQKAVLEQSMVELKTKARERAIAKIRQTSQSGNDQEVRNKPVVPSPLAKWSFENKSEDDIGPMHGELIGGAVIVDGKLRLNGKKQFMRSAPLPTDVTEKTLEAWVALSSLEQRGGGVISLESLTGGVFDAIVFGERQPKMWLAGSNNFVRTQNLGGQAESADNGALVHMMIVYQRKNIIVYRNGEVYGQPYRINSLPTFTGGNARVLLGLRHTGAGNGFLSGEIELAALYDYALNEKEVAACFQAGKAGGLVVSNEQILAAMPEAERAQLVEMQEQIGSLNRKIGNVPKAQLSYVGTRQQPKPTRRLVRGDVKSPAEIVKPKGLSAIQHPDSDFRLAEDATESERRVKLAQWMADPAHPLTARVMVNRVWHYHFGRGLVETPNDFGFNGARPTHPELLDWLAAEFVSPQFSCENEGQPKPWSIKHLHRLILGSATYQQSSTAYERAMAIDSDNALLWRFSPRRLEGEIVRDAMLAVSGQLNTAMGGPSFKPFIITNFNSDFYQNIDPEGEQYNRRTIYRAHINSGKSSMMDALDCPDPSIKTPTRRVTTTPLAALALMNNSFVLRQSKLLANRLTEIQGSGSGPLTKEQRLRAIERAYVTCLGRSATEEEKLSAEQLVHEHGLESLSWALLNASEFMVIQ